MLCVFCKVFEALEMSIDLILICFFGLSFFSIGLVGVGGKLKSKLDKGLGVTVESPNAPCFNESRFIIGENNIGVFGVNGEGKKNENCVSGAPSDFVVFDKFIPLNSVINGVTGRSNPDFGDTWLPLLNKNFFGEPVFHNKHNNTQNKKIKT